MNNKTWYNMTAQGKSEAEISIYGPIGGFDINAKDFAEDLKGIDADTIHLRIDSPGGSTQEGFNIINALKRHPAKVVTHIDGMAASMASVIAQAGDERRMANNSLMMIHKPLTTKGGNADELRKNADTLDKVESNILKAYEKSHYSENEIADLMREETIFTAEEALKAGLIDEIEDGLKAVASIVEMAKDSEIEIPTEKLIASMNGKLDAVAKQRDELSAKLTAQSQELVDARAELEAAEIVLKEVDEKDAAFKAELETAKSELIAARAEIETSKEVTDTAVALKAAEMLQMNAHAPVVSNGEPIAKKMTKEQFWDKYHEIGKAEGLAAKNKFYKENKDLIS
jgi:ATP-dependent protease ClpP protease subunit